MPHTDARPSVLPPREEKAAHVQRMFGSIAPRYDLLNHLLTFNIDRGWRRRAIRQLNWTAAPEGTYLDACAGTLDLAAQLAGSAGFRGRVVGSDFAYPMLAGGRGKVSAERVGLACADTLRLPFADAAFDGATVGFGIRNLADIDAGFRELARVLRPGARLVILEPSTPSWQPMRAFHLLYFRYVVPFVGRAVSGHATAYQYLPDSVEAFPPPAELTARMDAAGFRDSGWRALTGGAGMMYWGARA